MWNLRWNEWGEVTATSETPRRQREAPPYVPKKRTGKASARVVDYGRRAEILRAMGFRTYADYLQSPLWQDIRKRALKRDGYRCRACGGRGTQVHHQSYDERTLLGKTLKRLMTLCHGCHERIEVDASGRKKTAREAVRTASRMTRRRRGPKPEIDMEAEFLRLARSF